MHVSTSDIRRVLTRATASAAVTALAAVLGAAVIAGPATAAPATAAPAAPAASGTLQQVSGFGSNPGNLTMYEYAPANLPAGAPLVVALHGCTQTANDYYADSGWQKYADLWGFAVVFPQTGTANNILSCFSWFDSGKDTRGQGEAASVASMVGHAESQYGSDTHRVFVTGLSAGGGLAADLLADYPDVFAGGAVDSGLPAQCATTQAAASGCQSANQNLTPAQWGDKARASNPGYSGPWPRVAIWQGTSDTTVAPVNATELRDQWTDVWGIGQTPSSTATLTGGTTQSIYNDGSGKPAVELYQVSGMGHGLAVDPGSGTAQCGTAGAYFLQSICSSYYTGLFWGLDAAGTGGGGTTPPGVPSGLTVGTVTSSSVGLSWGAVSGAGSYAVYRNGAKVGSASGTSYTDTGLAAATRYTYTVTAVNQAGESAASAAVTATTASGSTPPPAQCFTGSNYSHVTAGRAHDVGGVAYANGSGQSMGLDNVFYSHTLEETSPGYYVIADSGCPAAVR